MSNIQGGLVNHTLFQLEITTVFPSMTNTADMKQCGIGDDGRKYAIKEKLSKKCRIPASEYFCAKLANFCNISTLDYQIAKMPGGEMAFVTAWVDNQMEQTSASILLTSMSGDYSFELSKIFLFDLFIHNTDRHAGNYFFEASPNGPTVKAFDHSRAFLCNGWPLPRLPLPKSSGTMQIARATPILSTVSKGRSDVFLNRLLGFDAQQAGNIFGDMPAEWIQRKEISAILKEWDLFLINRVKDIKTYLKTVQTP